MERLPARHLLRDERGTTLVEVIVAAVILVIISGAITAMLNAATTSSGQQRVQAIGADLAQATLEEWRTKPFTQLQNVNVTDPSVSAGGQTFQVHTESAWAMESPAGAQGCSDGGHSPEALRLSTTVTWNGMKRKPIVLDTMVAAPAGASAHRGTFVEQITDREGYGVEGVNVTISGGPSGSTSGTTDTNGCVRFTDIKEGRYDMTFSKSGYITPGGLSTVTAQVDVVAGKSTSASHEYDRAGAASIRFVRRDSGSAVALNATTDDVFGAQFESALLSRGLTGAADGSTFTYTQPNLYPTTAQYAVYPDTCRSGRPSTDGVMVPQNGGTSPVTDIAVPVVDPRVNNVLSTGTDPRQVQVRFRTACGSNYATAWTNRANNMTFPRLVLPGGTARVCLVYRYTQSAVTYFRHKTENFVLDANLKTYTGDMNSGMGTARTTDDGCFP